MKNFLDYLARVIIVSLSFLALGITFITVGTWILIEDWRAARGSDQC